MSGSVYVIAWGDLVKIGYTSGPPVERLRAMRMPCRAGLAMPPDQPGEMTLVGAAPGTHEMEQVLHHALADARVRGEWFRRTPAVERVVAEVVRFQRRDDGRAWGRAQNEAGIPIEF